MDPVSNPASHKVSLILGEYSNEPSKAQHGRTDDESAKKMGCIRLPPFRRHDPRSQKKK
jgi:hypothetical protein